MRSNHQISLPTFNRLGAVVLLLFAVSTLTLASKGGGEKKKHRELANSFTPISASSSFTLRKTPFYSGTMLMLRPSSDNRVSLNANITYQRGNTTFILPYKYKVTIGPVNDGPKSSLQFLGVRIQMPR